MNQDQFISSYKQDSKLQERKKFETQQKPPFLEVRKDGTLWFGNTRFKPQEGTLRSEVLKLICTTELGYLRKIDYRQELIESYFKWKPVSTGITRVITASYLRRQNNVDKAISRLRQDLTRKFKDKFPEGTKWLCHSKKIDGWLLYRLPGLGCDGEYHW